MQLTIPLPGATLKVVEHVDGDVYIVYDLEIKHAHADEVGAIFKGPVKSVGWIDGSCCKHFESHDRNSGPVNKFHGPSGKRQKQLLWNLL